MWTIRWTEQGTERLITFESAMEAAFFLERLRADAKQDNSIADIELIEGF